MARKQILAAILFILAVLMTTAFGTSALAGDEPLSLDKSSISSGQKDVPLDVKIELVFTNNVVNSSVAQSNASCFKLFAGDTEVPIDVVMADDQVEPDKKRIVTVVPKQALQKGRQYTLVIGKNVTSKNGQSMGSDKTISFTTQGAVSYTWVFIASAALLLAAALWMIRKRRHENKPQN